jgi:alkylation response protein AidB-like acyl-CoA dehydrogenase
MSTETLEDLESYRARARAWLADNMPRLEPGKRWDPFNDDDDRGTRTRDLQRKLFDGGYAGICYPKEYGGQGLPPEYQFAFNEESIGYEMPIVMSTPTLTICGPTILDMGTEEQRKRYIPKFLSGEEIWVQFMSEPSGGSDMAGALTRATRDGDVWVLSGSKIWSTGAYRADYALCLARTDWDAPKHRGLTVFIVKIHQPGITVNQIAMVDGTTEFCQEYFDDVHIPAENVVGAVNDGWTVASRLLFHERAAVGSASPYASGMVPGMGGSRGDSMVDVAKKQGRADDPVARQLVAEAEVLGTVQGQLVKRVITGLGTGYFPGPSGSLVRLYAGTSSVRRINIGLELGGDDAVVYDDDDPAAQLGMNYIRRQAACLGGGSTEMARNIISERILGMPREYAADRDVPFNQVRRNTLPTAKKT